MPKMISLIKLTCVSLALAGLAACSGTNSEAPPALGADGRHPADWVQQHWVKYREANGGSAAVSSATGCSQCHGSDLAGGISKVSCFSDSLNGLSCHNNPDHKLGHPSTWIDPTSSAFHGKSTFNGVAVKGATNLATACGLCHATDATTVGVGDAPSCLSTSFGIACHASSPAVRSTGCVSCHGAPPNGSSRPNRAGAHAAHLALSGVTCSSCHSGYGTGTARHATAPATGIAFLALSSAYRAESGSFSYAAGSCVAASCHGGKQTPVWSTGAYADLTTACLNCHSFADPNAPQYNNFFSGNVITTNLHQFHLAAVNPLSSGGALIFCTDCHNGLGSEAGVLAHFGNLATHGFEVTPSSTLNAGGVGAAITAYTQVSATMYNCANACHVRLLAADPTSRAVNPAPWVK